MPADDAVPVDGAVERGIEGVDRDVGGEDDGVVVGLVAGGRNTGRVEIGRPGGIGGEAGQGGGAADVAFKRSAGGVDGECPPDDAVPVDGAVERGIEGIDGDVGGEDDGVVVDLIPGGRDRGRVEVGRPGGIGGETGQGGGAADDAFKRGAGGADDECPAGDAVSVDGAVERGIEGIEGDVGREHDRVVVDLIAGGRDRGRVEIGCSRGVGDEIIERVGCARPRRKTALLPVC